MRTCKGYLFQTPYSKEVSYHQLHFHRDSGRSKSEKAYSEEKEVSGVPIGGC